MRNVTRTAAFVAAVAATSMAAAACEHAASSATSTAASAANDMGSVAASAGATADQAGAVAHNGLDGVKDTFADGEAVEIQTPMGEIAVEGAIGDKYEMLGGQSGPLGMPRSPEQDGPNGGKYQQFTGGDIYWSQLSGAHDVWGDVMQAWKEHGGAGGALGYPTTDEKDSADGGREAQFTGGAITWVNGQTTVTVH
jgi:hypothetical protein